MRYEITYTGSQGKTEIEADEYIISEGFLSFKVQGVNIGSIKSTHIDFIRMIDNKKNKEELQKVINQFKEKESDITKTVKNSELTSHLNRSKR